LDAFDERFVLACARAPRPSFAARFAAFSE
jgi:hypothetical protein